MVFFQRKVFQVSFATSCFEKDWKQLLVDPDYLKSSLIEPHGYPFAEKLLIINNVLDPKEVAFWAQKRVDEGLLSRFYLADDVETEMLKFFDIEKGLFKAKGPPIPDEWVYYNARGVLTAIFLCRSDFLLYQTGDVRMEKKINWIGRAIELMHKHSDYKVANLTWNHRYAEAKREAVKKEKGFFVAESGFSDQQFLVRAADFKAPIYRQLHPESRFFPWGDTFEKRVFSFMKNQGWKRMTYSRGSYLHRSF
ncbi:MAG: hypothetical protein WC371_04840 [Parachlamydiales bacterium]|jgi:hypothetical protein